MAFGLIASGDGLFTQTPVRIADVTDGTSNTAAFAESLLGNGQVPASPAQADPRYHVLEVPGGTDPTTWLEPVDDELYRKADAQ